MKKAICLLLLLCMTLLSACNASSGNANDKKQSSKEPEQSTVKQEETVKATEAKIVELRYAIWDANQKPAFDEVITKFTESNPNIKVSLEVTPFEQYWTKLESAVAGGGGPDVFWMNPIQFERFAQNGGIAAIDDYIKKDNLDLNNYFQQYIEMWKYDGKQYGLPKDVDGLALFYNKKIFDEAGEKYPDGTWDWNKLVEVGKKLTNPQKGIWGFAAHTVFKGGHYNPVIQNNGYILSPDKKKSGYDTPETIEAVKLFTDMILKDKITPSFQQMTETQFFAFFQSGKAAMIMDGSYRLPQFAKDENFKDSFDIAPIPKWKNDKYVTTGLSYALYPKSGNLNEAWILQKFLASRESALVQAKSGTIIPVFKGTYDEYVKSFPQYKMQVFIDMLPKGELQPVSKDLAKWRKIETEILGKVFSGQLSVEEGCKNIAVEMDKILVQ